MKHSYCFLRHCPGYDEPLVAMTSACLLVCLPRPVIMYNVWSGAPSWGVRSEGGSGGELRRSRGENNKKNAFTLPGLHSWGKQQQPDPRSKMLWHSHLMYEFLNHFLRWGSLFQWTWHSVNNSHQQFWNFINASYSVRDSSFLAFSDDFLRRLIDPVAWPLVTLSHCSFRDVRKYICVKLFSLKWKMEMKHLIKGKKWQEQLAKMIKWNSYGTIFLCCISFLLSIDKKYQRCQIVIGISEVSEKCLTVDKCISIFSPHFTFLLLWLLTSHRDKITIAR